MKCRHKEERVCKVHGKEITLNGFAVLWYRMIGVDVWNSWEAERFG